MGGQRKLLLLKKIKNAPEEDVIAVQKRLSEEAKLRFVSVQDFDF